MMWKVLRRRKSWSETRVTAVEAVVGGGAFEKTKGSQGDVEGRPSAAGQAEQVCLGCGWAAAGEDQDGRSAGSSFASRR